MPELAEVETVRNVLKKKILSKKIVDINIIYPKIIENDITEFIDNLIKEIFINIKRKGKYLIFETNNYYLISHLRMEGKYFYKECDSTDTMKHDHIVFVFEDRSKLIYNDTRKFGRMILINKDKLDDYFIKLGKEPKDLNKDYLKEKLNNKNKSIKTLLLDQSIIAGLGNIYANEVLYASKINPYKKGKELCDEEIQKIISSSQKIIQKAIAEGGCTIKSYTSSLGVTGNYQNYLLVHMKENETCKICKTKIVKEKIDGRSTYYCKNCQK